MRLGLVVHAWERSAGQGVMGVAFLRLACSLNCKRVHGCDGLNGNVSSLALSFEHWVSSWWHQLKRLYNLKETEPCWKKFIIGERFEVL